MWLVTLLGNKQLLRDDAWASSISPDGSLIAYHSHMDYYGGPDIWFMNERGEAPRKVVSAEHDSGFYHVSWSADGKRLAYLYQRTNAVPEIDTFDLASGTTTVVVSNQFLTDAYWLRDGRMVYALMRRAAHPNDPAPATSDSDLWAVSVDSATGKPQGEPRRLTDWPGFTFAMFSATADSKRLTFLKFNFQADVYVADLDAGATHLTGLRRLTLDEHDDLPTSWAADNKSVIFFSDRNGLSNIFRQAVGRNRRRGSYFRAGV